MVFPLKNHGKTGELGQDRPLTVKGQVGGCYVFVKNVVNLNVSLFLSVNLAKCG